MDYFSIINQRLLQIILIILVAGCQSTSVSPSAAKKATEGFSPQQINRLFVVDCLLPPEIRKMGASMIYLAPRRPIKTTAGECETRGGEYVAYDRANYASALKVWLPQAKRGDPQAQVTLGEIYESGMGGGLADPQLAFRWYKKAADQGNSRALLNLGNLYEKGLGVKKDLKLALNYYRKASGLDQTDLEFASVTKAKVEEVYQQKFDQMKQDFQTKETEIKRLRQQLKSTTQRLNKQRKKLSRIKHTLDSTRTQLKLEKRKPQVDQKFVKTLEKQLQTEMTRFNIQQSRVVNQQQQQIALSKEKLTRQREQLKSQEAGFHQAFLQIRRSMKQIAARAKTAQTTQDQLAVKQLRKKLQIAKVDLADQGQQIKQLKRAVLETEKILAHLEKPDTHHLLANAQVEIIEPSMVLTRGIPSYQLRSISQTKKIIGKVKRLQGLKSLQVNNQITAVDTEGIFRLDIPLQKDKTPVEVIATYQQGQSSVINFTLIAKQHPSDKKESYPSVNMTVSRYPSINFGRFYALIIGNQDYSQLPPLNTSINDAKAVDAVLRTRYGYQTTLLLDANRYQVMSAFNDLRNRLTEDDNLLVYYAGHGEIDRLDRSAYWLPTDADRKNTANWLSSRSITELINILPAKHILVVADSCYSGAMTETAVARLPEKMDESKKKKWLAFMVKRKARTVMTSGGVKPVLDTGANHHSVFANAFLKALKSNRGLMEDYELYRLIYGKVKRASTSIGFPQTPQYSAMQHAGHEGSPYFFVPKAL